MKTTIVMNECVISTELTKEELAKIKKFNPKALEIVNPETNSVEFAVSVGEHGSVSNYGIMFDCETADGKKAAVKIPVCGETVAEKKKYIAEEYGAALSKLAAIEEGLKPTYDEIKENLAAIESTITVTI